MTHELRLELLREIDDQTPEDRERPDDQEIMDAFLESWDSDAEYRSQCADSPLLMAVLATAEYHSHHWIRHA